MDSWHDDIKTDDMGAEFLRWFKVLTPKDRDIFFEILESERQKLKENNQQDLQKDDISQTSQFIDDIKQEAQEIDNQIQTNQFINDIQNNIEELKNQNNTQQQKEAFITSNEEALEGLELLQKNDTCTIYHDEMIFPEEKINEFEQELTQNPQAKLTDHLNIEDVKNNLDKEQEFQKIFTQEVASLNEEHSMEKDKKLNPDNYFNDLIDWFDKKKLENENMPLTKQEFKQEFLEYCKNGMNENEMKILLLLAHKEPSRLTKEHKDMINEGLKYNLTNNKLLDKGLETAIRAEVGENLINNNVLNFAKSAEKLKKSNNLIDKKMTEGTIQKIAEIVKQQTPNINQENTNKLNAIINNVENQNSKTKSNVMSLGR